jgi:Zn-dependent protease
MLYTNYLNGTLQSDIAAILSALPYYLIGGIFAWFFTYLGHRIACSIVKVDAKGAGVSYNPLKNISAFSLIGILAFPTLGLGWTKPVRFDPAAKGKSFLIALLGPLFCFIVSCALIWAYPYMPLAFLGSLVMGIATAGICFSVMNILPLPGLCGGVMLASILPEKASAKWMGLFAYYPIAVTLATLLVIRGEINTFVLTKVINFIGSLFA